MKDLLKVQNKFKITKKVEVLLLIIVISILLVSYFNNPVRKYKSIILNSSTVICSGMQNNGDEFVLSEDNKQKLINYLTVEKWYKITIDSDFAPYEYIIFDSSDDNLIVGLVDNQAYMDNYLLIQIYNKDKKYATYFKVDNYDFNIDDYIVE